MKQSSFKRLALGVSLFLIFAIVSPLFSEQEAQTVDYAPENEPDTAVISIGGNRWQYAVGYRYQLDQLIPSRQLTTKDGTLAFVSIYASGGFIGQSAETKLQNVVLLLNEVDRQIEVEVAATDRTAFDLDWSGTTASIKKYVEAKSRLEAKRAGLNINDISIRVMLTFPNYQSAPGKWAAIETYHAQCGVNNTKTGVCDNLLIK